MRRHRTLTELGGVTLLCLGVSCGGQSVHLDEEHPPALPGALAIDAGGAVDESQPFAIAAHQYGASALTADSARVYWATGSYTGSGPTLAEVSQDAAIRSCEFIRCEATQITYATLQFNPTSVAVDRTNIYWTRGGPLSYSIESCPLAGCPADGPTLIARGINPLDFVLDESRVYWISRDATILSCPLTGCGAKPELVALLDSGAVSLAMGGSDLYFATQTYTQPLGEVLAVAKDGSSKPRSIATAQRHPAAIAVSDDRVYWINADAHGSVLSCPRAGCEGEPTVLASGQRLVQNESGLLPRLAIDEKNVYWPLVAGANVTGEILECPLAGCGDSPKVLATDQTTSGFLALDPTHVYWTNVGPVRQGETGGYYDDGDLSRVAK